MRKVINQETFGDVRVDLAEIGDGRHWTVQVFRRGQQVASDAHIATLKVAARSFQRHVTKAEHGHYDR